MAAAADIPVPWGGSKLDYAGWIRGKGIEIIPGPITGLPIPKTAEIAIKGEIPPVSKESRNEGPFGEFGGYYSAESRPQPIVNVKAVYFREDPIAIGAPPFRGTKHDGFIPFADTFLFYGLQQVGLTGVRKISNVNPFLVFSMKPRYPRHRGE